MTYNLEQREYIIYIYIDRITRANYSLLWIYWSINTGSSLTYTLYNTYIWLGKYSLILKLFILAFLDRQLLLCI